MASRKEVTRKEAKANAGNAKSKEALEKLMLEECYKLQSGEQHSITQLLAYADRAKSLGDK